MKTMSEDFPQAIKAPRILVFNSENVSQSGMLGETELSFFSRMIRNRRSLPVFREGCWRFYECPFESRSLGIIALHVQQKHKAAPLSEEEILDDIKPEVG